MAYLALWVAPADPCCCVARCCVPLSCTCNTALLSAPCAPPPDCPAPVHAAPSPPPPPPPQTYHYRIHNAPSHDPTTYRYSMHVPRPLDVGAMRQAACLLVGTHDFTQLSNNGEDRRRRDPFKTLQRCDVVQLDGLLAPGALRLEARRLRGRGDNDGPGGGCNSAVAWGGLLLVVFCTAMGQVLGPGAQVAPHVEA